MLPKKIQLGYNLTPNFSHSLVEESSHGEKTPIVIKPHDYREFKASAISDDLIALNFRSLEGEAVYENLCYALPHSERTNPGQLRTRWLKRYENASHGGWWCSGYDPLSDQAMEWGCFKPDRPIFSQTSRKLIKYEHPSKTPTRAFFLGFPQRWRALAAQTEPTPIILTEGAKKAAALISVGYDAIALPGIYNGYRAKDQQGNEIPKTLIPELKAFCQPGREFILAFDQDQKPKTRHNVEKALLITGKLLEQAQCRVSVLAWPYPEKGIDDLLVNRGTDTLEDLYQQRSPLATWELDKQADLSSLVTVRITEQYLPTTLTPPRNAQLIGLKSSKGTGKTEWLAHQIQPQTRTGGKILLVTHRTQLGIELCDRLGLDYVDFLKDSPTQGILGIGLCIDSFYAQSKKSSFNPADYEGAWLILDEIEQVLWHLLNSATCAKARTRILETLQETIRIILATGGKLLVSDADLSRLSLDFLQRLAGISLNQWIVENEYRPGLNRTAYTYSDPFELESGLFNAIAAGERCLVHCSGQKAQSTHGTQNLEKVIAQQFPEKTILRIDAETISDPDHPAYRCTFKGLNTLVPQYDVVLCSPTVETGISITVPHFHSVWVLATGTQTVEGVLQGMERYRLNAPRHIYVAQKAGFSYLAGGVTSVKQLLRTTHRTAAFHLRQLANGLKNWDEPDTENQAALMAYAQYACRHNQGFKHYRDTIYHRLKEQGYTLINQDGIQADQKSQVAYHLKNSKIRSQQERHQAIAHANCSNINLTDEPMEMTQSQRYAHEKAQLINRYGLSEDDITPEFVALDAEGMYAKLRRDYYLRINRKAVHQQDLQKIRELMGEESPSKLFKPDIVKSLQSGEMTIYDLFEIPQLIERGLNGATFTKLDFSEQWVAWANANLSEIKAVLGFLPYRDEPIRIFKQFLQTLGFSLECLGQETRNGKRVRVYQLIDTFHLDPPEQSEESFQNSGFNPSDPHSETGEGNSSQTSESDSSYSTTRHLAGSTSRGLRSQIFAAWNRQQTGNPDLHA
ncbi:DUF3854 domain-containing protein [Spirulina sp. CS-785/01]|uniref:plasmid replication protein, CyRepA1 family n=1 Tax=Spirulina sp. CS-785/01 TaxID=3021716 RepID=UPI00232B4F6D|nr:plasmid replication protein, CyRepA1 family [Spirulina sp. CS-785/01]MDB9315614.1 DUF3854 domain-containing protein [Spirulina sp. CS-785/01]